MAYTMDDKPADSEITLSNYMNFTVDKPRKIATNKHFHYEMVEVLKKIEWAAKDGKLSVFYFAPINPAMKSTLVQMGYGVSDTHNELPAGVHALITWY